MGDSSASYIHMVQHLIEKCLLFHMTKEECMDALSKHANIKPVITSTGCGSTSVPKHARMIQYCLKLLELSKDYFLRIFLWNELEKENKEFFEAYSKAKSSGDRMSEAETSQMIQRMISESDSSKNSND